MNDETTHPEPLSLEIIEAIIAELLEMRARIYTMTWTVADGDHPNGSEAAWVRLWDGVNDTIRVMRTRFARDCPERCQSSPYYYPPPDVADAPAATPGTATEDGN